MNKNLEDSKMSMKVLIFFSFINQVKIDQFLESVVVTIVMTLITIYALFGDDVRVLATDKVL